MNFEMFEKNILMFPSIACNFLACCLINLLFCYAKTKFADVADTPGFHKIVVLYQPMNFKLLEKNILMFPSIVWNFLACFLVDFLFSYAKTKFADAADTPGFYRIGVLFQPMNF